MSYRPEQHPDTLLSELRLQANNNNTSNDTTVVHVNTTTTTTTIPQPKAPLVMASENSVISKQQEEEHGPQQGVSALLNATAVPFKPLTGYNSHVKEQQRIVGNGGRSSAPPEQQQHRSGNTAVVNTGAVNANPRSQSQTTTVGRALFSQNKPQGQPQQTQSKAKTIVQMDGGDPPFRRNQQHQFQHGTPPQAVPSQSQSPPGQPTVQRRIMRPVPIPAKGAIATGGGGEDEAPHPKKYRLNPYSTTIEAAFQAVGSPTASSSVEVVTLVGNTSSSSSSSSNQEVSRAALANAPFTGNSVGAKVSGGEALGASPNFSGGRSPAKAHSLNSSPALLPTACSKEPSPASLLVSPAQFPAAPSTSPAPGYFDQFGLPPSANTWNNQQQQQHHYYSPPPPHGMAVFRPPDQKGVRSHSQDSNGSHHGSSHGPTPTNTANSSVMTPPPQQHQLGYYSAPPPNSRGGHYYSEPANASVPRAVRTSSGPSGAAGGYPPGGAHQGGHCHDGLTYSGSFSQGLGGSFGSNPSFGGPSSSSTPTASARPVDRHDGLSPPPLAAPTSSPQQPSSISGLASIDLNANEEGAALMALNCTSPSHSATPTETSTNTSPSLRPTMIKRSPPPGVVTMPPAAGDRAHPHPSYYQQVSHGLAIPNTTSHQQQQQQRHHDAETLAMPQQHEKDDDTPRRYTDLVRNTRAPPGPIRSGAPSSSKPHEGELAIDRSSSQEKSCPTPSTTATSTSATSTSRLSTLRIMPSIKASAPPAPPSPRSLKSTKCGSSGASVSPAVRPAVWHTRLATATDTAPVPYYAFPSQVDLDVMAKDPTFCDPPLEKHQMARVFLGQLPYTTSEVLLQWIAYSVAGGVKLHYVEKITKNSRGGPGDGQNSSSSFSHSPSGTAATVSGAPVKMPTGCFHAYVQFEDVDAMLVGIHKKMLLDEQGLWLACYPGAVGENMMPVYPSTTLGAAAAINRTGGAAKTMFPSLGEAHGQDEGLNPQQLEDLSGLEQLASLREYCGAMRENRNLRIPHRPYGAVVAQLATSTYDPESIRLARLQAPVARKGFTGGGGNPTSAPSSSQHRPSDYHEGPRGGFRPQTTVQKLSAAASNTAPTAAASSKTKPLQARAAASGGGRGGGGPKKPAVMGTKQ